MSPTLTAALGYTNDLMRQLDRMQADLPTAIDRVGAAREEVLDRDYDSPAESLAEMGYLRESRAAFQLLDQRMAETSHLLTRQIDEVTSLAAEPGLTDAERSLVDRFTEQAASYEASRHECLSAYMASQHANAAVRHEVEAGGSPSAESLAGAEQAATAYQAALGRMDEALAHAGLVSAQLTHPEGAEDGATGTSAADPAGDSFAASAPVAPPQGTEAAAGGVDTGDDFAQPAPAVGDGEAAPADMVISLQEATAQRQTEAGDVFSQPAPQGPADQEAPAAAAVLTPAGAPDAGSDVGSSGH